MSNLEQQVTALEQKIQNMDAEREALAQALTQLKHQQQQTQQSRSQHIAWATVTQQSSSQDKVKLFRNLFKGRDDVYPKRWEKGTLTQYVGRLHRLHHAKAEVRIYDYVDSNVPMLERMRKGKLVTKC